MHNTHVNSDTVELARSAGYPPAIQITHSELQLWLRKNKGIRVWAVPFDLSSGGSWAYNLTYRENGKLLEDIKQSASNISLRYEEALEEGLVKGLNLFIENKLKGSPKILNDLPSTNKEKKDSLYNIADALETIGEVLKVDHLPVAGKIWELEDDLRELAFNNFNKSKS